MPLEAMFLGYAGFANLALSSERYKRMPPAPYLLAPATGRIAGIVLIGMALVSTAQKFGVYQGIVAWIGMLGIGGIALVLMLSCWPRVALALWSPALLAAILFSVMQIYGGG